MAVYPLEATEPKGLRGIAVRQENNNINKNAEIKNSRPISSIESTYGFLPPGGQ